MVYQYIIELEWIYFLPNIYVYFGLNIIWLLAILFYNIESEAGNINEIEFERKMHFY